MKKVAVIFGSPRKNSNTHLLVKEAQRGLADCNIDSEIFFLNDMNIKGCQACYYCKKNNTAQCSVNDDMQKIYQAMEEADGIIVATPIYFSDVTAQTKIWLDRLFPYIDMNLRSLLPRNKRAAIIFTQNQPNPDLFAVHMQAFARVLGIVGFEVKGSMLAYDIDKGYKPMVTEHEQFMQNAYTIGRELLDI